MNGRVCDWAACHETIKLVLEGGWWHCPEHLAEHREMTATGPAPARATRDVTIRLRDCIGRLVEDGLSDREIALQFNVARTTVQTYRRQLGLQSLALPPVKPCGTHSAFNRHKAARETPCDACVAGEAAYQAAQWLKKKQRQVAA